MNPILLTPPQSWFPAPGAPQHSRWKGPGAQEANIYSLRVWTTATCSSAYHLLLAPEFIRLLQQGVLRVLASVLLKVVLQDQLPEATVVQGMFHCTRDRAL